MKKFLMIPLLVVVAALTSRAGRTEAQPAGAENLGDNAALKYWLAFAMMPNLTDAEDKIVGHWRETPLGDAAGAVVAKSENALKLLQVAAQFHRCDWGLAVEGADTLMPHLAKARQIARLACLRARYRASKGDGEGAVRDLLDVFMLSRQCNSDCYLISLLVRFAVEGLATDAAADSLMRLDRGQLKKLADGLDALPEKTGYREAILSERELFLEWYIVHLKSNGVKGAEELKMVLETEQDKAPAAIKEAATQETVNRYIRELEKAQEYYAALAGLGKLPLLDYDKQAKLIQERMKKDCPIVAGVVPAFNRARYEEARSEARMAMLKAGIAIVLDGPDRVKDFKDPFGDGPFEYHPIANGFQLKSKLLVEGKPVYLTFPAKP